MNDRIAELEDEIDVLQHQLGEADRTIIELQKALNAFEEYDEQRNGLKEEK